MKTVAKYIAEDGVEFTMQESLQEMMEDGFKMYGVQVKNGRYYDTGNKLEYLKAVVDFALLHDDIAEPFKEFLRTKAQ